MVFTRKRTKMKDTMVTFVRNSVFEKKVALGEPMKANRSNLFRYNYYVKNVL